MNNNEMSLNTKVQWVILKIIFAGMNIFLIVAGLTTVLQMLGLHSYEPQEIITIFAYVVFFTTGINGWKLYKEHRELEKLKKNYTSLEKILTEQEKKILDQAQAGFKRRIVYFDILDKKMNLVIEFKEEYIKEGTTEDDFVAEMLGRHFHNMIVHIEKEDEEKED